MVGCVVADDVDHRRVGAPGVMHVGEPVGESWPQMQKGRSRPVRHARIAIGRARHNALEQPEHAPHIADLIQRRDEVHLRGARVGEATSTPALANVMTKLAAPFIRSSPMLPSISAPTNLGLDETVVSLVWAATADIFQRKCPTCQDGAPGRR